MKAETRFIRQIQKMASDVEFQSKHVRDGEKDFKRTRKLTFSDVIMYTIGNTRSPLELEAQRFSKYLTADEISGAALCKARQKIKYTAFEELFEQTAASAPKDKRFHGYHLYAVVNILNQQKPLWRYQNHFYMKENNVYVPYNKKEFICRVYSDVTALGYEFTQPAICSITNELEMRADLYQGEPNDERYTYCSNGFLNNRTGLFDIVSDYFPTIQLTGAYLGSMSLT